MFKTCIKPLVPLNQDENRELKAKIEVLFSKYVNGEFPKFKEIKEAIESNHERFREVKKP